MELSEHKEKKQKASSIKRVEIILGFACNNHCLFCSTGGLTGNKSTKQAKQEIIRAIKKDHAKEINFTGGEPTIRKDIFELVQFAKDSGAKKIRVTTNGRMFSDKKFTEKIVKAGLTGAIFSIHSESIKIHDSLSDVNGALDQTIRGLKNAKNKEITLDVNTVLTKENMEQLPELAEMLARNFSIRGMCIIFPEIDGFVLANPWLVPDYGEASQFIDKAVEKLAEFNSSAWVLNFPACLLENKDNASCGEFNTKMYWFEKDVDLDKNRRKERIKTKQCKTCSLKACSGIPKKFIELKGEPKLKPVI